MWDAINYQLKVIVWAVVVGVILAYILHIGG